MKALTPKQWRTLGLGLNLASALAFYLATYFLKLGTRIDPTSSSVYAYGRYFLGSLFLGTWIVFRGKLRVDRGVRRFVFVRALGNLIAVLAFYKSVELGNAGIANVLNMTYPVFVVLFAGPVLGERPSRRTLQLVGLAFLGILLNFPWEESGADWNVWALFFGVLSAVVAGIAVVSLRGAVQAAPAETIMFWMFASGTLAMSPFFGQKLANLPSSLWPYVLASALLGIVGQWLLAHSYRFLDAASGSLLSSSRILIAILLGFLLLEEHYTSLALLGAALIGLANVLLALYSRSEKLGARAKPDLHLKHNS